MKLNISDDLKPIIAARILKRVVKSDSGCWLFSGSKKNKSGHRQISIHGRSEFVHRVAYAVFIGPIPEGKNVCHSCDVPECVNPSHFFAGTQLDNMSDCVSKGRLSPPPIHSGSNHHNATLSKSQVEKIRRLRIAGLCQRYIAARFGCSQSTVWRIVHLKTRQSA